MADDYTIKCDSTGNGQVICNGKEMPGVVGFEIRGGVDVLTEITLRMIDVSVDVSLEGLHTDDPFKGTEH